ncbi:MAG: 50S ribosomal protein L19 [Candidatus Colwellbacteria bacterium]|nr:50S ribosomal protein L19 [Candidatus Colwellbacteria bacterium]
MISKEILGNLKPGSQIKVYEKTGTFQGIVLARKHGTEPGATFTVRNTLADVGVEKIYPIHSPSINKVEILSSPQKVRRSKLYYLRGISKKNIRRKLGIS